MYKKLEASKALVIGLGKSGKAAAEALLKLGAKVDVYDGKEDEEKLLWAKEIGAKASFGERPDNVKGYDFIVMSPGISADKDFIREAEADGAEVIGELELAFRYGKGRYTAITGTNGKTTTTALTGEIFKAAGRKTEIVGNIGIAVVSKAMGAEPEEDLVTECSSFQLETTKYFRPKVSAILNITPDHLDRHKTMENYALAKGKIFANQSEDEYFVYNEDDELTKKTAELCKAVKVPFSRKKELSFGVFVKNINIQNSNIKTANIKDSVIGDGGVKTANVKNGSDKDDSVKTANVKNDSDKDDSVKTGSIVIRDGKSEIILCRADELKMPGLHNLENALAAAAIAHFSGIESKVISDTLKSFPGVAHRIEDCGTVKGVRYINDSKGTNPDAAIKAVMSFNNIVLIAGGYDKGASYDEFAASFAGRVKVLVVMGATADKVRQAAEKTGFSEIYKVENMKEAVEKSSELAKPGDTVLLSPACASWDMYSRFEDRGDDFKQCVKELG